MTTIDQIIAEKINSIQFGDWPFGNFILCAIALILSILLCGLIGYERELKGSNAGFRTHLLVGIGSCIIMIVSIYGFPALEATKRDVARLAAAVVTGVGFLGAGAIMHRNAGITGLTTAATIWLSMAIGLACGSMNFILATGGTFLILVVLVTLGKFEVYFSKKKGPQVTLKATRNVPVISYLLETSEQSQCRIHNLQMESLEGDEIQISFGLFANNKDFNLPDFLSKLEKINGVKSVTSSRPKYYE